MSTLNACIDCLDGLIGLKCSSTGADEDVCYYLSDLPGIDMSVAVQVAKDDQITGEQALRDAISFAARIIAPDFLQRLKGKGLLFKDLIDQDIVGTHGQTFLAAGSGYKGIRYRRIDPTDRYIRGFVEYFELKVADSYASTAFAIVADGIREDVTVDLACGINRIPVNRFFREDLLIFFDTTGIEIADPTTSTYNYDNCGCYPCDCCGNCIYVDGISVGEPTCGACPPVDCMISTTANLNGFVSSVSCRGWPAELVCRYRQELATPMLYRAGAHIMESVIGSARPNPYVRNTKEQARELFSRWMGGIDPLTGYHIQGEYPRFLQTIVDSAYQEVRMELSRAFGSSSYQVVDAVAPLYHPRRKLQRNISRNKSQLNINPYGM